VIPPLFDHASDFYQDVAWVCMGGRWRYKDGQGTLSKTNLDQGYEGGRFGFIDRQGRFVIEPTFDHVWPFTDGLARVNIGGKWSHGSKAALHTLNRVKGGRWGFVDGRGRIAVPLEYDDARHFKEGRAAVLKDGKWGFVDREGRISVEPRYDEVVDSRDGRIRARIGNEWFLLDPEGTVLASGYEEILEFHENLARVKKRGRWGYIDPTGSLAIPLQDLETGHFHDGRALVRVLLPVKQRRLPRNVRGVIPDDRFGYIDRTGKIVIEPRFTAASDFKNGVAYVDDPNTRMVPVPMHGGGFLPLPAEPIQAYPIDLQGRQIGEIDVGKSLGKPLPFGSKDSRDGDPFGRTGNFPTELERRGNGDFLLADLIFANAGGWSEGMAWVWLPWRWGYADELGELVIPPLYDTAGPFIEGRAKVTVGRKTGLIDTTGAFVTPPRWDGIGAFSEGKATVQLWMEDPTKRGAKSATGIIDRDGQVLVEPDVRDLETFRNGRAVVQHENGRVGVMNERGEWIVPPGFLQIQELGEGLAIAQDLRPPEGSGKFGLIDSTGAWTVAPQFAEIGPFMAGYAVVRLGAHLGMIDKQGNLVAEPKYDVLNWNGAGGAAFHVAGGQPLWGVIDPRTGAVSQPVYEHIAEFSEGLAAAYHSADPDRGSLWGYIDATGRLAIPQQFQSAGPFNNGVARVQLRGIRGYVDRSGSFTPGDPP
jgi:hypothetical protein